VKGVDEWRSNAGVGTDEQKKAAANWTVNTHIFDNILKNLKVVRFCDLSKKLIVIVVE